MFWLSFLLAVAIGYLLGSIPFGYLVARAHGIDIREHGSGNIGATNVLRVLGKKPGILVFFCDAFKGWLAVFAGVRAVGFLLRSQAVGDARPPAAVFGMDPAWNVASLIAIAAALACILGHNFPVWLKFRGGKGIATTTGVLLGLMPLAVAVAGVIWAAAFFTLRYVSVASLLAAATLPVTVLWLWRSGRADAALLIFSLIAAALAFWRHRSNIQRLLAGTEPRFVKKPPQAAAPPTRRDDADGGER